MRNAILYYRCSILQNYRSDVLIMDEYIVVKALENGVNIIGLTSGKDTKFHHTEKLDKGEVFLAQFTDVTTAIKINGAAEIYTKHGKLMSDAR